MADELRFLTVPDVMARTGLARHEVYRLINMRRLESVRIGRCRRVPQHAVNKLIDSLEVKDGM
jgi:excisionase family DNA binding protein